jgi:hypothetical protein
MSGLPGSGRRSALSRCRTSAKSSCEQSQQKAITLDMGGSRHFPPFPMLFLAAKILELREAYPDTRFDVKNYADHDYAAHMRFFKAAGFDIGNEPWGSERQRSLFAHKGSSSVRTPPTPRGSVCRVGRFGPAARGRYCGVVSQDEGRSSDFFNSLSYSLRELIRNVFEHSGSDRMLYCAQYWPAKQKVEVCILDRGVGIRQSLKLQHASKGHRD